MKYQDLSKTIRLERFQGPITGLDEGTYALKWLDEHPEERPKKIVTEKEFEQAIAEIKELSLRDRYRELLSRFGTTIVPDPVPTNFDRLKLLMIQAQDGGMSPDSAAEWLDFNGVKAPGGSDE